MGCECDFWQLKKSWPLLYGGVFNGFQSQKRQQKSKRKKDSRRAQWNNPKQNDTSTQKDTAKGHAGLLPTMHAPFERPAIPAATELLRGLCATAGLCLERAECTLRARVTALREQLLAVQKAMERSQRFWRTMLAGLPEGCHLPLSPRFRWRRHVHCAHKGPQRLRAALATEVCECGGGSSSPHRALVLELLEFFRFELNKLTRARLSGGCAARCSGCTCPRVPPFGRGPPRGTGASSSLSRADLDNRAG